MRDHSAQPPSMTAAINPTIDLSLRFSRVIDPTGCHDSSPLNFFLLLYCMRRLGEPLMLLYACLLTTVVFSIIITTLHSI